MLKNPAIDRMRLDGGVLCLDFVNTVPDRLDGTNRDNLRDFNDLIYWSQKAKIINNAASHHLEKAGDSNERKTKEFFTEAIKLRALIYAIFRPIGRGKKAKSADLKSFNKLMIHYFQFLEIGISENGFIEQWNFHPTHFYSITAPIVKSAHALMLSNKLQRVKECPNCGWLFLDATKNGKRRWCSMKDCGSNVKARDYYYRKKKALENG